MAEGTILIPPESPALIATTTDYLFTRFRIFQRKVAQVKPILGL
jgi:hypothetical protein